MSQKLTEQEKRALVKRYHEGEQVVDICAKTGVAKSTFYTWVKKYGNSLEASGNEISRREIFYLKRRLKKLEDIVEVLRRADCKFSAPLKDKLYALEALHGEYDVHTLCEALEVSRGTFYNHIFRNQKNKNYQKRRDELSEHIRQVFLENRKIYGAKKITAVLRAQGIMTSDKMVAELMTEMNLHSIRTDSKRKYKKYNYENRKDVLKMNFHVDAPNQVWVSDITHVMVKDKTYYVCAILDLYSRKAIAYKISSKQSTQLIAATFREAYAIRQPREGLTFHSDRGAQYTSHTFCRLLTDYHVTQSFSPSGSPHHNAVMESFFSSMKQEEIYYPPCRSVAEFHKWVKDYMQFYDNNCPHSTLRYKTPNAHESMFYGKAEAELR